jgi:hypothetical protein
VVNVLLGLVRVVPAHPLLEPPAVLIVLDAANVDANDPLECVQCRTGTKAIDRRTPVGACAQIDRVVVAVGKAESQQYAARRFDAERVDELLAHETHRRRAEDHHALLVQPDDPLIGAKIQQLGQVKLAAVRPVAGA